MLVLKFAHDVLSADLTMSELLRMFTSSPKGRSID